MPAFFLDKSTKPNDKALSDILGRSYNYWEQIRDALEREYGQIAPEWKYYGARSGWTLKMMFKKRNLFFLAPCEKYFRIAFVFGDKAVRAIEQSDLPPEMIREVNNSKRYPEGRALRIEVRKREQVNDIIKLAAIKINN
jgi:hypothetical protein